MDRTPIVSNEPWYVELGLLLLLPLLFIYVIVAALWRVFRSKDIVRQGKGTATNWRLK